jgi:peptide/nickel transport system substrate-binding protein
MTEERGYWQRKLSRRSAVRGATLAGAGLAAASLIACSGQPSSGTTTTTGGDTVKQPKKGGLVTHAGGNGGGTFDSQGVGLDPHTYLAIATFGYRLFYQGLLSYDLRTYEAQPQLGQKWEQPSQSEYIFTLQPGVKFHNKPPANGRAMTAQDVVFSLERSRTNEPRFLSRSILSSVDKIEAVDANRVRITTKSPDATTLSKLSADPLAIMAPEVVEKAGRFATADAVVGTGAFMMKSVEDGVGAEYVRNPDYWKQGLPYLDGVRTVHLKDEQAGYAAFQGGQVDIGRVPGTEVKGYVSRQGAGFKPDWFLDNTYVLGQPNTKVAPMDDKRVYRALRLFIDYNEMIPAWAEVWFGQGQHGSVFPTALQNWDLSQEDYAKLIFWKKDKADAIREGNSLLSAAGYSASNPLKFEVLVPSTTPFLLAFAEIYQAQWKKVSNGAIDATLDPQDIAVANQRRGQRQFTYMIHGNVPGTNEPDSWLSEIYKTGGSANFMNFSDTKFDEMIDKQRTVFDLTQRKSAIREIVSYYAENGPGSVPANRLFLNALRSTVRNYAPEFYMFGNQYEQIWLDT